MNPMKHSLQHLSAALLLAGVLTACGNQDPQALVSAARDHLQKNDPAAAIIELKNALQEKPDFPEARLLLGKALLESGDVVGAEAELRKAREVNYLPDEVSPLLAKAWLGQGEARKVTEAFDQVRLESPQAQADLLTSLAIAWRAQGKAETFRQRLDAALELQPEYAPALIERARLKAADRDFKAAVAELDRLIAREPKNAEAIKLRGDVLLYGLGERDQALAAYQSAVEAAPKYLDGHSALVRLLMAQSRHEEAAQALQKLSAVSASHPVTLYLQAQQAVQKQDFKLARERVQQLLKRTPDSPTANELAGVIELQNGSVQQAQNHLAKALQAAPELRVARRALVLAHLRSGQVDQAIAALPAGLTPEKADADEAMLSVAGRAHMAKGDFALAQAYFKRAAAADPKDPAKRTSLALSQFRLGQTDLALTELNDIAAQDTGIVADMALINAHMQRRDFDKALAAIDSLEKKRAQDPAPKHLRGLALMLKGDRAGARKAFESAVAADGQYLAAVAGLATLDLAEKQPQAAVKRLEEMTQRAPQNAQAWLSLADALQSSGAEPAKVVKAIEQAVQVAPTESRARVMLVDHHLRQKDPKSALTAAQAAAAALPDSPDVVTALGRSQAANGEYNQAVATFNKLLSLVPQSPAPYMLMAGAQSANKDAKGAMQSLGKALELQVDFLPAQLALAELAVQNGQPEQALAISKTVQKQRPNTHVGFAMEGDLQAARKQWDAAAAAYRTGLKQSAVPELAIKLHSVLLAGGKSAEADRWSAEWLKSNPKDVALSMYLGDRAIAAGQLPVASRHYEKVVAQQPNNALALNNLAWLAGQQGRGDAIALAEKANAVAPNQPAFMDTLAMLLSAKGEHARALELQKKVLDLKPDAPVFKLNMAKIQIAAGDKAAARKVLDELTSLGDKFSAQKEVQNLRAGL